MTQARIVQIDAVGNIRLCRNGRLINPKAPVYKESNAQNGGNHTVNPAAFPVGVTDRLQLHITVDFGQRVQAGRFELTGWLAGTAIAFKGTATVTESGLGGEQRSIQVIFPVNPQPFPGGFLKAEGDQVNWKVRDESGGTEIELQSVNFELYWLNQIDNRFFKRGVPVEILRSTPSMTDLHQPPTTSQAAVRPEDSDRSGISEEIRQAAQIVKYIFERNPPRYDIIDGSTCFTAGTPDDLSLNLNAYIKSLDVHTSVCNCMDLAALVQYHLQSIGIKSVEFCFMKPFGYLRPTRLMGRGLTKNLLYKTKKSPKENDANNQDHIIFSAHTFCRLGAQNRVLDACIGPYTGNEDSQEYLDKAIDRRRNPLLNEGNHIQTFRGVTKVNINNGIKSPVFKGSSETLNTQNSLSPGFQKIVHPWPNPSTCPELSAQQWKCRYETIMPGREESVKTWMLEKDNQTIKIDLYVSSETNDLSHNRYRALLDICDMFEQPSQAGPGLLAQPQEMSTIVENGKLRRFFWVFHNLVFDVSFRDVVDDDQIESLLEWLMDIPVEHIKDNFETGDFPNVQYTCDGPGTLQLNSTVTIDLNTPPGILNDFDIEGDGLILIEEEDHYLRFRAVKESTANRLSLIAVDRSTLIGECKIFDFTVQKTDDGE